MPKITAVRNAPINSDFFKVVIPSGTATGSSGEVLANNLDTRCVLEILSIWCRIVTSANVATRVIFIKCRDQNDTSFYVSSSYTINASTTAQCTFTPDAHQAYTTYERDEGNLGTLKGAPRYLFFGEKILIGVANTNADTWEVYGRFRRIKV